MTKANELRKKSEKELKELLEIKMRRGDELKFLLRQKKVKNVKELSNVKKDIARILTITEGIKTK